MEENKQYIEGYKIEDIKLCLGTKSEYYIDAFKKIESKQKTFNYASAFVSDYWMAYHMMWKEVFCHWAVVSLITSGLGLVLGFAAAFGGLDLSAATIIPSAIIMIADYTIMGYLGNHLYWKNVKALLDKEGCKNREEDTEDIVKAILIEESKPSVGAIFITGICFSILNYIVRKGMLMIAAFIITLMI